MSAVESGRVGARADVPRVVLVAAAAVVVGVLRLFLDAGHGNQTWSDIIAVGAFGAVGLAIVAVVVPRALRTPPGTVAWTAVGLGAVSVVVLVVFFFSPAPFVLGYGSWFLGRSPGARAAGGWRPRTAVVLGILVMALNVLVAVVFTVQGWAPGLPDH